MDKRALRVLYLNPEPKYRDGFHQGVQLTMVDNKLRAIMGRMYCKDYVTDLFWSELTKTSGESCGFCWRPGQYDPTLKWHRLSINRGAADNSWDYQTKTASALIDVDLWDSRAGLEAFFNAVEEQLGFRKTQVFRATGSVQGKPDHTLLVRFSVDWTDKPVKISLFTLLCRVGLSFKPGADPIEHIKMISTKGHVFSQADLNLCGSLLRKDFAAALKMGKLENLKPYSDYTYMAGAHGGGCIYGISKYTK